jgi:hypothetical protein
MFVVLPLLGRISMTRFSPPERYTREQRTSQQEPNAEAQPQTEREQPKFRRIAILASVPGLSRPV